MKKVLKILTAYIKDPKVRLSFSILSGLFLNGIYIVLNIVMGIIYKSERFITFSVFYLLLFSTRYLSFDYVTDEKKSAENEMLIGILLPILAIPMSGMIIYSVKLGEKTAYPSFLVFPFALYFLYSLTRVVSGLILLIRRKSGINFSAYAVRLSALLFSLFNFQLSLLPILNISEEVAAVMNRVTGFSVSVLVSAIAFAVLRRSILKKHTDKSKTE